MLLCHASPSAAEATETPSEIDFAGLFASFDASPDGALAGPWTLALPADFGAHPEARSETWSLSATLEDADGRPLALTFVLTRLGRADTADARAHPWGPGPFHVAQAALNAAAPELRGTATRASRSAGTAGHDPDIGEVWLDDWTFGYGDGTLNLALRLPQGPAILSLRPEKPPVVLAGEETPGTRGFAVTRLSAAGTLASGDRALQLTGTAWLDRVWGDVPLPGGPLARDRLVLHLSDGTDLSLLRTRRRDGRGIATLDGILVARDGTVRMLDDGAVDLVPVSESGEGLPAGWRLTGAGLDLRIMVGDAAFIETPGLAGWTGLVSVAGMRDGQMLDGAGTLLFSPDGSS
jgi:predicted secreted hydrolase